MRLIRLVDSLKKIAAGQSKDPLNDLVGERPEDLADAMQRVPAETGAAVLNLLEPNVAAEVLVEVPTETARRLIVHIPDETIAAYLDVLPMDDAVEFQEELGTERFERILELIPDKDVAEIRRLMSYPKGTVGRLMTEAFFHVKPDATMAEALSMLRSASEDKYETVNDIYVLNEDQHLIGVMSLRKALRANPWDKASEIIHKEVISCNVDDDDEEAARMMARYGFYALPVLDDRGRMLGLFTGDDAQTILRESETEQVLSLGGVSGDAESYLSLNIWQLYKRRVPWLLILFFAEMLTGSVLRWYGIHDQEPGGASKLAQLMFFVPLLIGAGGNSGSQVTTTITRALSIGEITSRDALRVLSREFIVAVFIGLSLGFVGFARSFLPPNLLGWGNPVSLSLTVGMTIPAIVIWAACVGSLLPIGAKKVGLDPAVMSAPFIATLVDASGLIIYFEIARRLFPF